MARSQKRLFPKPTPEGNIPYKFILSYASHDEELKKKFEHASTLQTVKQVLAYVRGLKKRDGSVDQCTQFLILALHKKSIEKYPFLNRYLNMANEYWNRKDAERFGYASWAVVAEGINDQKGCLTVGPYLFMFLCVSAGFFAYRVIQSFRNESSFKLSGDIMSNAIAVGITLFGTAVTGRTLRNDYTELGKVRGLWRFCVGDDYPNDYIPRLDRGIGRQ